MGIKRSGGNRQIPECVENFGNDPCPAVGHDL